MNSKKQRKSTSYQELSNLVVTAIEEEQFFRKDVLVPKVKAILSGFQFNLNAVRYNKIESPSDAAKRLKKLQEREIENLFWKNVVRNIDDKNKKKHYKDCDEYLKSYGLEKSSNTSDLTSLQSSLKEKDQEIERLNVIIRQFQSASNPDPVPVPIP